jgi:hypothetical protein
LMCTVRGMNDQEHDQPVAGRRTFSEAYDEFVRKVDLEELNIDPDEVWAGVRSHDPAGTSSSMPADKMSISGASSYREIGEYWDEHDLSEVSTRDVEMDVDIQSSITYFPVPKSLAERLRAVAADEGISAQELLNRWIEERTATASEG